MKMKAFWTPIPLFFPNCTQFDALVSNLVELIPLLINMNGLLQQHAQDRTRLALWQSRVDWKRPVEGLKESLRIYPDKEAWVGRIRQELRITDEAALGRLGEYHACFTEVLGAPMPKSPRCANAGAGTADE